RENGVLCERSQIDYTDVSSNKFALVVTRRRDQINATGAVLATTTRTYAENIADSFLRSQIDSVTNSNGTMQVYARQRGAWNGTLFTPSEGGIASRICLIT